MKSQLFLKTLSLNNFATFENQVIEFNDNLNVIIGETGSGKSLIFDSLQIVLGLRADKKFVRKNAEFSVIEAVFCSESKEIHDYLIQLGYPNNEDEIIIKRIIYNTGKTKNYLNYQSCNLNDISNFSKRFVDFVGQFENQKLLSPNYQLKLLDSYSKGNDIIVRYQKHFSELKELKIQKEKIKNLADIEYKKDYLTHQISELKKLNPSIEDENYLIEQKTLMLNREKILTNINQVKSLLDGDESFTGIINGLKIVLKNLNEIQKFSSKINLVEIENYISGLSELSFEVTKLENGDDLEFNLDDILEKLDLYQKIKRKYNLQTNELTNLLSNLESELQNLNLLLESSSKIDELIKMKESECFDIATIIHEKRLKSSKLLSLELTKQIQNLNMKGAEIIVQIIDTQTLNEFGKDSVSILAQTNPGEGFFPIKDIASGGELSRILLALRALLSVNDTISIFLFDEIDTGLGGETASSIGKSLKNISTNSQVITISHLPQIAIFADQIIAVDKNTFIENKETRTLSKAEIITGSKIKGYVNNMVQLFN